MKEKIHPNYGKAIVRCVCGETFETGSVKKEDVYKRQLLSTSSSISGIGVTSLMFAASTCTFTITLRLLSTVRCSL